MPRPEPRPSRPFWDWVEKRGPDECWPWTGYVKRGKGQNGHGLTNYKGYPIHASRKAWILTHGWVPHDLCVNHRCDNKLCCNPAHMYLGTRADNMIDYWGKTPPDERGQRKRSTVLDEAQLKELWAMRGKGALLRECAEHFGVHIATVCRYITVVRKAKLARNRAAGRQLEV